MAFSENDQKIPKITYTATQTGCHICQAPNLQSELWEPFEWTLIELGSNMIENLLCLGFYFSLSMVLLCVIFKSVWYLRAAFWVLLHAMFVICSTENNLRSD